MRRRWGRWLELSTPRGSALKTKRRSYGATAVKRMCEPVTRRDWFFETVENAAIFGETRRNPPAFRSKARTHACAHLRVGCVGPHNIPIEVGMIRAKEVLRHGELWSCCWLQELLASRWKAPLLGMQSYAAQSLCAERFEDRRHAICLAVWYHLLPHDEAQCQFRFIFANCLSYKKQTSVSQVAVINN